ncbi:hypothetical protein HN873_067937, partial [Arachis hypogaea]
PLCRPPETADEASGFMGSDCCKLLGCTPLSEPSQICRMVLLQLGRCTGP